MKFLELFCGTKSVGKVCDSLGYETVSLDFVKKNNPTICCDILDWNYKKYFEEHPDFIPDFIWASPPCQTFSVASGGKHRLKSNMESKTEEGEIGLKILERTIEIIKYIEVLNPKVKFAIENPKGLMRYCSILEEFNRTTGSYCKYGSRFMKNTDIWNNFNCKLLQCKYKTKKNYDFCHHESLYNPIPSEGINHASMKNKYHIPFDFVKSIIEQSFIP